MSTSVRRLRGDSGGPLGLTVGILGALIAVRIAVPLSALAASGSALPGLPRYEYVGLTGDAEGFYAATREFIAAGPRLGIIGAGALVVGVIVLGATLVLLRRRRMVGREWTLIGACAGVSLAVTALITQMHAPGAAVFGWPLMWSLPLFPLRAFRALGEDGAFATGVVLSLAFNSVTVVATYFVGSAATGKRAVGFLAAGLFAFWPLLVGLIAGHRGWENGSWAIDAGLHMYTEPLSTALVTGALALILVRRPAAWQLALAGIALSFAALVKLSNGILALVVLLLIVVSRRFEAREVLTFAAGGLTFVPALIAYWPRGYVPIFDNPIAFPQRPFALEYFTRNWADSLLFSPRTLVLLLPLAVVGVHFVRSRYVQALLVVPVLVNAAFYSFYRNTALHPRFLFVSLPVVFVLCASGAIGISRHSWVRRTLGKRRPAPA